MLLVRGIAFLLTERWITIEVRISRDNDRMPIGPFG
jgi:hypothetical protein